jgi:U3 small nucleolar RNA-associated protein 12
MVHAIAKLPLASRHRVSQILFHETQPYLAVQSHDRSIEIFRIRTEDEIRKKQARRRKRAKEKSKSKKEGLDDKADEDDAGSDEINLIDLFTPYLVVRANGKIRSFDFGVGDASSHKPGVQVGRSSGQATEEPTERNTQLFLALASNALEVYDIPPATKSKEEVPQATRTYSLDLPGHRTDVRTLCLSSDDQLLASASNGECPDLVTSGALTRFVGSLKVWNMKTTACIRTIDCGSAICSTFLPGDRHVRIV